MCHFSSYQWGVVPAILNIICMFIRHESEAQSLSPHYNKKLENIFSSLQFHPLLLHFHLPDGRCALTFAGIIFLSFPIFLAWYA